MSHPTERCELTNLCMITDAENRILVQDRTDPVSYTHLTLPTT